MQAKYLETQPVMPANFDPTWKTLGANIDGRRIYFTIATPQVRGTLT